MLRETSGRYIGSGGASGPGGVDPRAWKGASPNRQEQGDAAVYDAAHGQEMYGIIAFLFVFVLMPVMAPAGGDPDITCMLYQCLSQSAPFASLRTANSW